MPDLIEELLRVAPATQLKPTAQLTFYEDVKKSTPYAATTVYTEYTEIVERENPRYGKPGNRAPKIEYVPGQPQVLRQTHLAHIGQELVKYLIQTPPYFGSGNLLCYMPHASGVRLLWWVEGGDRYVNFGGSMAALGSGTINLPRTLLCVTGVTLSVYCLPATGPVTSATPLLMTPYPNTNNQGGVCTGSAKAPSALNVPSIDELMHQWEVNFFYSEFTHLGGAGEAAFVPAEAREGRIKGSIGQLWQQLMVEKSTFPTDILNPVPGNKTVGDLQLKLCS